MGTAWLGQRSQPYILRYCNPNPNSLERLWKDPVYHLAKHPGFAKQQNSSSPVPCLPRLDRFKAQPSWKQSAKPSHFLLFYSGRWLYNKSDLPQILCVLCDQFTLCALTIPLYFRAFFCNRIRQLLCLGSL